MGRRPECAPLDRYLDRICRRLWLVPARERRETREELRQHLEKMAAHAARTVEPTAAMEDAMEKFGDPKEIGNELSRQHLHRRRWLSVLIKTATGAALMLLTLTIGYSAYWYFALSRPMEREAAPTPITSAAATLAAIQAAHDGYARQIQSVRFQSEQAILTHYQGHEDKMVTHTCQVAVKGDRYYSRDVSDERHDNGPDQTSHEDDVYVSDGQTLREVLTEWNGPAGSQHAKETHGLRAYLRDNKYKPHDPDEMLQYGYKVGSTWIGDVLRRGQPVVEGTVANAWFGPLTIVRCRNKTSWGAPEMVRLWLAPELGWLAVRSEIDLESAGPNLPIRQTRATRSVARSGPFWVTMEANLEGDHVALGRRQQLVDRPVRFAKVAFNDVPDTLFSVRYAPGTQLWKGWGDDIKVFILRPSGQWEEYPLVKQPLISSPGIASLWPFGLAGVVVLGGYFAVLRVWRRGLRLKA